MAISGEPPIIETEDKGTRFTGLLRFLSAVASTSRICSGVAPTVVSSSFISTEKTTSNFLEGSPEKMLAEAVPLMLLIRP